MVIDYIINYMFIKNCKTINVASNYGGHEQKTRHDKNHDDIGT
jgi:hypothetical protein